MTRRLPARAIALAAGACGRSAPRTSTTPMPDRSAVPAVSEHAMRVYRDAVVIDTHNDVVTKFLDDRYDLDVRHEPGYGPRLGHTDVPRLVQSGMTAEWLSAWVDAPYAATTPPTSYARAVTYLDAIHALVDRHPRELLFATTAADVRRAKESGRVAILVGVEGGHAIESSLDKLRDLHRRGVRYLTLTWNNGNDWAGSSVGVDGTRTGGLTPFGRNVIREMNRIGMLVDVSHVSDSTLADVLAVSALPVIASHSSARAINDHPRNLTDDQLRAIAAKGGVVNVNFYSRFLDPAFRAATDSLDARMEAERTEAAREPDADTAAIRARFDEERRTRTAALPQTPFSVLIDHIDHVARVAGVDHVGLGSDFDGVRALPIGMDDVTALPRIVQALLDRDYSDADAKKILGGNMLRVMDQALDASSPPKP